MKNYPFTKVDMFNWKEADMNENSSVTYPMETIAFIESKLVVFDDSNEPRPAIVIHFNTNQTATFDAANWSIGFI